MVNRTQGCRFHFDERQFGWRVQQLVTSRSRARAAAFGTSAGLQRRLAVTKKERLTIAKTTLFARLALSVFLQLSVPAREP
jgi:hypothetical protein